jgi:hypothetical protein
MATRNITLTENHFDAINALIADAPCPLCLGVASCLNSAAPLLLDGKAFSCEIFPADGCNFTCPENRFHVLTADIWNTSGGLLVWLRPVEVQ